jgi:hypothetical protein
MNGRRPDGLESLHVLCAIIQNDWQWARPRRAGGRGEQSLTAELDRPAVGRQAGGQGCNRQRSVGQHYRTHCTECRTAEPRQASEITSHK